MRPALIDRMSLMQEKIAQLEERLSRTEAERNAAMADLDEIRQLYEAAISVGGDGGQAGRGHTEVNVSMGRVRLLMAQNLMMVRQVRISSNCSFRIRLCGVYVLLLSLLRVCSTRCGFAFVACMSRCCHCFEGVRLVVDSLLWRV